MEDALVRPQTALRIEAVVARLAAAIASSDTLATEQSLARYLAARREQPSATRDLRFFRPLAEYFARQEDWQKAAPAFRAAAHAIDEIASAWADPADQAMFLARQSDFLNQAGDCLRATGKASDAERLVAPLLSLEAFGHKLAEVARQRNRRRFRAGLWLILLDVLCSMGFILALGALGVHVGPGRRPPIVLSVMVFTFALFTIFAVVYLLFHLTIGRLIPSLRRRGGSMTLMLSCMPWLAVIPQPFMLILSDIR